MTDAIIVSFLVSWHSAKTRRIGIVSVIPVDFDSVDPQVGLLRVGAGVQLSAVLDGFINLILSDRALAIRRAVVVVDFLPIASC